MLNWYLAVLKNYAVFRGRARRKEYWMYVLFHAIAVFILMVVAIAGSVTIAAQTDESSGLPALAVMPVILYMFATVIPTMAAVVRRLHDTGRSGWWYLITFIPFGIGGIVLLVFAVEEGQPHDNQYGPSPKPVPDFHYHPHYPGPFHQGQPNAS